MEIKTLETPFMLYYKMDSSINMKQQSKVVHKYS